MYFHPLWHNKLKYILAVTAQHIKTLQMFFVKVWWFHVDVGGSELPLPTWLVDSAVGSAESSNQGAAAVTTGWSIHQGEDGDGGERQLFTTSTALSGITGNCSRWLMYARLSCPSRLWQLMHFYYQAWPQLPDTCQDAAAQVRLEERFLNNGEHTDMQRQAKEIGW